MRFEPIVYSDWAGADFFPKFNWKVSISIDTFNFADITPYKIFLHLEPPEIRNLQGMLIKNKDFYDLILTYDEEVLSQCRNAVVFPLGRGRHKEQDISQKKFAASFLTSSKEDTFGHKFRLGIFNVLPEKVNQISITKYKSPPRIDKRDMLIPFQYNIAIENSNMNNFFTEILIDCLMTKTIPIYWGFPNLNEYFNVDGIVKFDSYKILLESLETLTPDFYFSKKEAIEDNYNRALGYVNLGQRVFDKINEVWANPRMIGLPAIVADNPETT
jgi:hypothetical protein